MQSYRSACHTYHPKEGRHGGALSEDNTGTVLGFRLVYDTANPPASKRHWECDGFNKGVSFRLAREVTS